ncbi:uncharacterized protein [Montipora foliosa]|uniref:uncharacterized protein n=1 Tax=Montipora foliosa TaxID=591990 RepID=UPI0035F1275D
MMAGMLLNFIILLLISTLEYSYQDIIDHRGTEFIISFAPLHPFFGGFQGTNVLYISSFENSIVRLEVPFLNQSGSSQQQYDVFPGKIREIVLPGDLRMGDSTGSDNKGIRLTSDKPITVHGLEKADGRGEAFLVLPVDSLGRYYIVATYFPMLNAIVQVTAKEDNTVVLFSLKTKSNDDGSVSYGGKLYGDGDVINVTLNALDVFQVLGTSNLTGTVVRSSKPIAVFSGNDCTWVPYQYQLPCNQLIEQIPPVGGWGKHFITSPTPNSPDGDIFHIIASQNNTDLRINGKFITKIQKGLSHDVEALWNQSLEISTSQPSLVVQYTKFSEGKSTTMSIVPSTIWSSNDFSVYVEGGGSGVDGNENFVNVVTQTYSRNNLRVRGPLKEVPMKWTILPGGNFSQVSLNLSRSGLYHIFHNNPLENFTAVVYGKKSDFRFSFPAGFKYDLGLKAECVRTKMIGGDKVDNDCDGKTDEELSNGRDDDGDGDVDEDLFTPPIDVTMPRDLVLLTCSAASNVADSWNPGFFPKIGVSESQGICAARGNVSIWHNDNERKRGGCSLYFTRNWTVEDSCQNERVHTQWINITTLGDPVLTFPSNYALTCRDTKYLDPTFTGEISQQFDVCKRRVNIKFIDKLVGDCSRGEAKLERAWMVEDKCRKNMAVTQVLKLIPRGPRTTNYKVSFSVTSEDFSPELTDRTSKLFKTLSADLEQEMENQYRTSQLGNYFLAAKVLDFSNGSVNVVMLVEMHLQANIDANQLLYVTNDILGEGMLGKFLVDNESVTLQDFDECQSPDFYECHEKATCINTLGSYNCTCLKGYFGDGFRICQAPPYIWKSDPPISSGTEENVTLRCHARGYPDPTFLWIMPDDEFVNASSHVVEFELLDDDTKKTRGKILQKDGSLLVFNTRVHDSGMYKCLAVNVAGRDEKSVNLTVNKDIVEVDVAITLEDEVFDESLENKSSVRYQEMEKKVEKELTELFKDIEGFERIEILGFVNGSVKVRFRVIVKVDKTDEKEPTVVADKVGKTLRVSVKSGKIGSLKVKPVFQLREVPPPPANLAFSDLTSSDAMVTWSHPELHDMYEINGYSLQFKKFGLKKWTQFVFTKGEDHRLYNLEQDTPYFVRLKSENEFGKGEPSEELQLRTKKASTGMSPSALALAIVLPILLLLIFGVGALLVYRRWRKRKLKGDATDETVPMNPVTPEQQRQFAVKTPNGASVSIAGASFSWREIPRHLVTLGKVLGQGEFGIVVKGELTEEDGRIVPCAVKKLKRSATESDFKDLLNELEIMSSVGNHPNLVNLIGACSVDGPLMILVEFAEHGNLLHYLRERRKQNYEDMNEYTLEISSSERLRIACDVCEGMNHLAIKKCAHRDLAARNVLLAEGMVAKVSDFGLSRDIYTDDAYEKKTAGKLPGKWMAVESLEQGVYTSQSDVWSFGVLLWEIETGGCAPYAGMVIKELLEKLKVGSRLEKPRYCSDSLYGVMLRCWNADPKTRPTFEELSEELHRMHRQETDYLIAEDFIIEPDNVNTSVEDVSTA